LTNANPPRNNRNDTPPNTEKDTVSRLLSGFALAIAIGAAAISYLQYDIARDTAIRQLRAYVSTEITGRRGLDEKHALAMGISLVNFGQTPARKVQVTGQIEILPFPLPKEHIPKYSTIGDFAQTTTVFPNKGSAAQVGWIPAKYVFSHKDIHLITSNTSNVRAYIFGHVTYLDVFNAVRNTYFCQFIDPKSIKYNLDCSIKTFIWANAERYNTCD